MIQMPVVVATKMLIDIVRGKVRKPKGTDAAVLRNLETELAQSIKKEGFVSVGRYSVNEANEITRLDLSELRLKEIPKSLYSFQHVEVLSLCKNELEKLHPDMKRLASVMRLDLSNNRFKQFPLALISMANLRALSLSHNEIAIMPPEIAKMGNLADIELRNNGIRQFPSALLKCPSVESIDLRDNKIEILPQEIVSFERKIGWEKNFFSMYGIFLENNPLSFPPCSVVKNGKEAVQAYFGLNKTPAQIPPMPASHASSSTSANSSLDLFISHASEDKAAVARPLYNSLVAKGFRVWFDESTLELGDSLRRKIDEGLAHCRYGVVIISPQFLAKQWPQRELDGLVARETSSGKKAILPIWHELTQETVLRYSPTLADRLAARSEEGIPAITDKIIRVLKTD